VIDVSQSPGLPPPEATHAVVVYDAQTGEVLHRHIVVRYPGGRVQEPAQIEARALELAAARGLDTGRARVLHVDPAAFAADVEHRVNIERRELEELRRTPLSIAALAQQTQ
jgi:hypothetical protein